MILIKRILLLGFMSSLIYTCSEKSSNPLRGGVEINFTNVSISNMNDVDGDGYYSSARVNWQITSDGEADLIAYLSYRSSSSGGNYTPYKEGSFSVIEGSSSGFLALGGSGFELNMDCYDFQLEIFDAGDMDDALATIASGDLVEFCMETADDDFLLALSISDSWITGTSDPDGDGYYSAATLNWTVSSNAAIAMTGRIKLRDAASTGSYVLYKEVTFSVTSSGSSSWSTAIGNEGFRLPHGCYDISLELYDSNDLNTILAQVSADNDNSLNDLCMEDPAEEVSISISDAWIDNLTDIDGDGYNSAARINWSIVTNVTVDVVFRLSIREASSTGSYSEYKVSSTLSTSSQDWFWNVGDAGNELSNGSYDFLIELLDPNNLNSVYAERSADADGDINNVNMEYPNQEMWELVLNNTTYTPMSITAGVYGTQVVNPGGSYYYAFTSNPGEINITANTSGTYSDGGVIGIELFWNFNITPGAYYETDLVLNSDWFFLYYQNNGGVEISPIYVNYGTADETVDNVLLPSNNIVYSIGYYRALSLNNIRAYWYDGSGTYWNSNEGTNFFYNDPDADGYNYSTQITVNAKRKQAIVQKDENWLASDSYEGKKLKEAKIINTKKRKYINPYFGTAK